MTRYIDAHTHHYRKDVAQVLVFRDFNNFSPPEDQYFTIGLHPWDVENYTPQDLHSALSQYVNHPNFLALGEIGLDKGTNNFEKQKKIFLDCLQLARQLQIKRIVLHCVRAQDEIIYLLAKSGWQGQLLWHGHNGNDQQLEYILNSPWESYFGLGKTVFGNAKITRNAKNIPLDRILFETDDSMRHKIEEIYLLWAQLFDLPLERLKLQIAKNFEKFIND